MLAKLRRGTAWNAARTFSSPNTPTRSEPVSAARPESCSAFTSFEFCAQQQHVGRSSPHVSVSPAPLATRTHHHQQQQHCNWPATHRASHRRQGSPSVSSKRLTLQDPFKRSATCWHAPPSAALHTGAEPRRPPRSENRTHSTHTDGSSRSTGRSLTLSLDPAGQCTGQHVGQSWGQ